MLDIIINQRMQLLLGEQTSIVVTINLQDTIIKDYTQLLLVFLQVTLDKAQMQLL